MNDELTCILRSACYRKLGMISDCSERNSDQCLYPDLVNQEKERILEFDRLWRGREDEMAKNMFLESNIAVSSPPSIVTSLPRVDHEESEVAFIKLMNIK